MLKVHQMRHEAHFTILANEAIRDGRLSGLARSVLMELISRPPGWQTNADQMWRQARKDRGDRAEGRRAFRAAFAELEEFGYLIRKRETVGNRFETVLHLFHLPQEGLPKGSRKGSSNPSGNGVTEDEEQDSNSQTRDDSTSPEEGQEYRQTDDLGGTGSGTSESGTSQSGTSETGTSIRKTDHGSTDVRSTEEEESFRARSTRSGAIASDHASDETQNQQRVDEELSRRYNLVRRLSADQLREALYSFEKKRPSIYRQCRQLAIRQYDETGKNATAHAVDQLSYMYAVQHYSDGIMPLCLSKPLGVAA